MSSSLQVDFMRLFRGREDAFGTGEGRVVRRRPMLSDFVDHMSGPMFGPGLGIFPLLDDGAVWFAAIDLDEPDFETAREMARLIPGIAWIERSRSGNAHIWVFFAEPLEAWVARGVLKAVTAAVGKPRAEIFPKQDALLEGMVGNYINLPYHGDERPVTGYGQALPLDYFVSAALDTRNDPDHWRRHAAYIGVEPPQPRAERLAEFGQAPTLHECAEYIIEGARSGERPLTAGHRSIVLFSLAKQLLNWREMDEEQAWGLVSEVNALAQPPVADQELRRIFDNAASGRWTSTGCDDPVMDPYVSPTCPIARRTS